MFGGGTNNPYDDIVNKTTDENLTSENWELILNLCDKVQDEGSEGAHSVIAAVLKRLAHRNPNVQLYALSLAESLSKNLGIDLHREIASKAFTQGLEKLITDRNTHEKVKRRTLELVATWTADFENDSTLGVMEDCYNGLKAKGYKFEAPQEPPPPAVDDEIRRKEEEELQRVLEMSMQDKGGRGQWTGYSPAASSSGAGASGSSSNPGRNTTIAASKPSAASPSTTSAYAQPKYQAGYVPARTPSPVPASPQVTHYHPQQQQQQPPAATTPASPTTTTSTTSMSAPGSIVTRVRALHTFEPTEPGELAFEKGDVIKVVDRGYKDWWRGQLKGRTGIFPVNYVEAMPEPTAAEMTKEAEQEAAVFAQAVNVEKLLNMLRSLDPAKDNLADNEEIQELYRSSMALRPKIVKLIDKYSQKRADLVSMNETFVRARTIFDRMMEESLARHTGVYEQSYRAPYRPDSRARAHPEYMSTPSGPGPQPYGWNTPGYASFPTPAAAYPAQPEGAPGYPGQTPVQGPQQYPNPNTATYAQQQQQLQAQAQAQVAQAQAAQAQAAQAQAAQAQAQVQTAQAQAQAQAQAAQNQAQAQATQASAQSPVYTPQGGYAGQQPGVPYGPQGPTPYPAQTQSPQPHAQPQQQQVPQQQPHVQTQPTQAQAAPAQQVQPQQANSPQSQQQSGPPYVFTPGMTYADPNVQAWADYYSKGGRDLAGAVYFVSIPGVKEASSSPTVGNFQQQQGQAQPQQQQQPIQQQQPVQQMQPAQQGQPHHPASLHQAQSSIGAPTQQTPITRNSVDTLPYPGDAAPSELAYAEHDTQQQAQPAALPMINNFSSTAPVVGSSVPSWVLPKKTTPPPSIHGPNPGGDGQGTPGSYFGLQGQFATMNVGDGGSQNPQHHGIGTHA